MASVINAYQSHGFWVEHPNGRKLDTDTVTQTCPVCKRWTVEGRNREALEAYREHITDEHMEYLEDCGCCGGFHLAWFQGDCREDWERF